MNDKFIKILDAITLILVIGIITITIIFIIEFKEMLNDHRCYNLPLSEFYQDKKCERYWDLKEWENK